MKGNHFCVFVHAVILGCVCCVLPVSAPAAESLPEPDVQLEKTQSGFELTMRVEKINLPRQVVFDHGEEEIRVLPELPGSFPDVGQVGAPALPYLNYHILLPAGTQVQKVSARPSLIESLHLAPGEKLAFNPPANRQLANEADESIYQRNVYYPRDQFRYLVTNLRGYQILTLSVTPLRYNPVTGDILFAHSTRLMIQLAKDPDWAPGLDGYRNNDADRAQLRHSVLNPEEEAGYHWGAPSGR